MSCLWVALRYLGESSDKYRKMEMTTFTEKLKEILLSFESSEEGLSLIKRLILEEIPTKTAESGDKSWRDGWNSYRTELLKKLGINE